MLWKATESAASIEEHATVVSNNCDVASRLCVVVPTYNRIDYLSQTLDSLLHQTCTVFDIMIVDNCSTDGTWAYLLDLTWGITGRVQLVRNHKNLGAVGSAALWSKRIAAPWSTIVCDDDWVSPDFVETLLHGSQGRHCGLIVVDHLRLDSGGATVERVTHSPQVVPPDRSFELFGRRHIRTAGISGFALPTKIIAAATFPRDYPGGFCEDGMICLEALAEGGSVLSGRNCYFRREWDGAESQRPDRWVNSAIAYAIFAKDVRALRINAGIVVKEIPIWERRPLLSDIACCARAVFRSGVSWQELRQYWQFAKVHGVGERCRAVIYFIIAASHCRISRMAFRAVELLWEKYGTRKV